MAFSQPNSRELQNRKILEEIQLKKQLLLKQGVAPTLGTSLTPLAVPPATSAATQNPATTVDGIALSASQRAALHNAHAASAGFFVTQDSSFGNLILPVLPRFETK
ncbi:SOSS complex subunit C homolog isoform X2 [Neodiprion pinetum]|uniref:SOSS complex subunit C homolog isoform X2 n=1 Tax=Neodiprion lecontei TaxID=441921 RepID=A0A6J0BDN0_NEOLC|nr:SOSS complex subunit C homolog isoform X2 [Neodiprion lecontei]XP_046427815.1 SOSS complex subunit C homolog isoform X2 [Neodiprion fabricii]XP_046481199.1 SOSS complex subunit C homolog isoform X2 [Neodiprion pinetum]XP_046621865.1 SOSS complex subunit C homolog isoform X2 [Neodiprion virginianus]